MTKSEKVKQFRDTEVMELNNLLNQKKQELQEVRTSVAYNKEQKIHYKKIRSIRRDIARINTIIHEKALNEQKELFKNKKWIPKALRPKLTRAIRRRLTSEQKNKMLPKVMKKQQQWIRRNIVLTA